MQPFHAIAFPMGVVALLEAHQFWGLFDLLGKTECESKTKRAFTRSQHTASLAEINKSALTDHAN